MLYVNQHPRVYILVLQHAKYEFDFIIFIHFDVFFFLQGCKGFFRRMIKERSPDDYKCPERNNCEVNTFTRNICRACRFRKCLMAGMSIDGSRIGRQSNLFKHKMVEMQRRGLIQSQLINIVTSNVNKSRKKTSIVNQGDLYRVMHLEDKLEPQVFQQIIEIENAYINHLKVG